MADIQKRRIVLGLTGGIAAYKAAELTRLLVQDAWEVQVVMTQAAGQFITPATLQALSGRMVYTDLWDARIANNMAHIDLSRGAEAIVVAPASADFMAKVANGLADDLLSTLCLARECPLLMAPAMNRQMWENPATQRNVATLARDGVAILGPASGDQACGEVGMGRMLEAEELYDAIDMHFQPKVLAGKRVLVTAGPTFEPIDTVRGITNLSSGKMGYSVARAALEAGAEVTLISGPVSLHPPLGATVVHALTARDMFESVKRALPGTDVFVSVAAVADYHPVLVSARKIKKSERNLTVELAPNPDILAYVAALPRPPFCVGFAAESENLETYADAKRRKKKVPLIAANLAQSAIGADENELILLDDSGRHRLPKGPKLAVARQLIHHVAKLCTAPARGGKGRRR
ncbi:MAG: bifunctional phosphopantothenoylcysteine decarboxylase/phosphopantothenate--cysteine ligase CoaBC [Betaproteobacteria bacterium]|nr:bifunctional phosphopantothenoylcysteine decarboxylase/phosphopantothenate--cysteine ligase CoaBC [Betaproteobacteria bacterium]